MRTEVDIKLSNVDIRIKDIILEQKKIIVILFLTRFAKLCFPMIISRRAVDFILPVFSAQLWHFFSFANFQSLNPVFFFKSDNF